MSEEQIFQIALIEDYPGYRNLIEMVLEECDDLKLVWKFGSAEVALERLTSDRAPDILILDLGLPHMGGLEVLPFLKKRFPDCRVIALTQSQREADVVSAFSLGAVGYLLKSASASQIIAGIRLVAEGGILLDQDLAAYLVKVLKGGDAAEVTESPLTDREMEVMERLAEGLAKKQIADELNISENTVVYHVSNIYEKLQATNAPSAVAKAFGLGLLPKLQSKKGE